MLLLCVALLKLLVYFILNWGILRMDIKWINIVFIYMLNRFSYVIQEITLHKMRYKIVILFQTEWQNG